MTIHSRRARVACLSFAILSTAYPTTSMAEAPAGDPIESITVSATPISIDDAGSSVNVITREDILRRNAPTISSLLREIPGFAVSQQGSEGAVSQVRVRGAEANQLLVLINGIEVNDPAQSSEFDFSQLSTNDIERIEIVRGPQSALWGSDAMAGVVHIITVPSSQASGIDFAVEAGSFSTQRATATAQHAATRHQVKFSADYLTSDGTNISRAGSEDDGLENLTLGLTGRVSASDVIRISYTARYTDKTAEFDGVDFFTTGLPVDADNETESTYLYTGVTISHDISDVLDHALSLARTDTDNETFDGSPVNAVTRASKDAIRYQINAVGNNHRVSLLLEHETEDYEQRGAASFFGDPNKNLDTETDSAAVEYRYDAERINLSASVRHDNNSEFDDADSWRITGNYKLTDRTAVFGSAGESVKNPTFTERFGFFDNFVGNPDLAPEQSLHWEVGVRSRSSDDRWQMALTYFDANLEDEINGFVFDAASGGFTAANINGESERHGVEFEAGFKPIEPLDIAFTYTYIDATQEDALQGDIDEVRRPAHIASLSMHYSWQQAGVNFVASYTGEQDDDFFPPVPPFQERVQLDAYTLISLSGYYEVSDNIRLTGRLENLTDESYEQVFGYASPGFGGYLGIRVSL